MGADTEAGAQGAAERVGPGRVRGLPRVPLSARLLPSLCRSSRLSEAVSRATELATPRPTASRPPVQS